MKKKILIVEDEQEIVHLIQNRLDANIYDVAVANNGDEAMRKIRALHFDLITLDIMLPFLNGYQICQEVRKQSKNTLIVMVSSLETEDHKLTAYSIGADDYMAKPFSPKELAAKIGSLLQRRFDLQHTQLKRIQNLSHDLDAKTIYCASHELKLTPSEYTILALLLEVPQKVFSRDELSQRIYDKDLGSIDNRGIDTHIHQIRKKISLVSEDQIIKTERGMGYTICEN